MPTVYIVCGNTGAGKSTYSIALAKEKRAVLFSIDSWMQTLYADDYCPGTHDFDWILQRDERCKVQIRKMAGQILDLGIDVALDMSFGRYCMRQYYREWAEKIGAATSIHYLDVEKTIRKNRVRKRNTEQGETFQFTVTDEMFDYVENLFDIPGESELIGGKRVTEI